MRNMFLKSQAQVRVEKVATDRFLKNQNGAYLWINSLKFHSACFYCISNRELPKHIET